MDKRPEEEDRLENAHSTAETYTEAANQALTFYSKELLSKQEITPEFALEFVPMFVWYNMEWYFHQADSENASLIMSEMRGTQWKEVHASKSKTRSRQSGDAQIALRAAQNGDYTPLKDYLPRLAEEIPFEWVWGDSKDTDEEFDTLVVIKEKLIEVAEILPERGPNFVPPGPAWNDPRFNGDQEQDSENPADRVQ